jgi:hypothetical protein
MQALDPSPNGSGFHERFAQNDKRGNVVNKYILPQIVLDYGCIPVVLGMLRTIHCFLKDENEAFYALL